MIVLIVTVLQYFVFTTFHDLKVTVIIAHGNIVLNVFYGTIYMML